MRKRIVILGLLLAMTLETFAGCSRTEKETEKESEIVTEINTKSKYYYDFGDVDKKTWVENFKKENISDKTVLVLTDKVYRDDVLEKINEKIYEDNGKYNITVVKIPWEYTLVDTMSDFISYIQENGIKPDILCSIYGSITNSMPKEMLYDITNYFDTREGRQLKKAIDDTYWTLTEEDGHWYGVGTVVERCSGWLVDRNTMLDLDLTVEDLAKPIEELEAVFEKVKNEKPELTPFVYSWSIFETDVPVTMYDRSTYIGYWDGDSTEKVENLLDDSRTYEFVKCTNTYGEKGYAKMIEDVQNCDNYFMMAAWNVTPLMRADSLDLWSSPSGRVLVKIPYGNAAGEISVESSIVLADSNHIEQSLDFLTKVNTTKEMSELLLYGIEDIDYTSDGNTYQTDKSWGDMNLYDIPLGNLSICTNMEPYMDPGASTARSDIDKLREKMKASDFTFDSSKVEKQYDKVSEIYSSLNTLYSLFDFSNHKTSECSNWEEYYEKLNADLKEVGISEIVDEINSQMK